MITKLNRVIRLIEESQLDGETKLLALCEIDLMDQIGYANFAGFSDTLAAAFKWNVTELGQDFWVKIWLALPLSAL